MPGYTLLLYPREQNRLVNTNLEHNLDTEREVGAMLKRHPEAGTEDLGQQRAFTRTSKRCVPNKKNHDLQNPTDEDMKPPTLIPIFWN